MSAPKREAIKEAVGSAPTEEATAGNGALSREQFLAFAGKRSEAFVEVPEMGRVLVGELTGQDRAETVAAQLAEMSKEGGMAQPVQVYQSRLLLHGVLDPASPANARLPLFHPGDVDTLMKVGGAKLTLLLDEIERLSAMGRHALVSAEGNSEQTPSAASTSG